jgi:hypothetical protein
MVWIDQVGGNPSSTDQLGYIQLFDGGAGESPLNGLVVVVSHADDNLVQAVYPLTALRTDANGYFVLGSSTLTPPPDLAFSAETLLADVSLVALYAAEGISLTVGAALPTAPVLDAVLVRANTDVEGAIQLPANLSPLLEEGLVAFAPANAGEAAAAPAPRGDTGICGGAASAIHEIQGASASSPLVGATVLVEGLVTASFQDAQRGLRGFFLQEEASDFDNAPASSEGVFVLEQKFRVQAGDLVRVKGKVHEFNQLTELKNLSGIQLCSSNNPITPTLVTLPETVDGELERYEGMLVQIANSMTVAQSYFLGRYGQLTLSASDRLYQPTHLFAPGSEAAQQLAAANARQVLVLDDGQDIRAQGDNPNPVPYLGVPPPAVIRAGDVVTNLLGVLDFGRINAATQAEVGLDYRLHPTTPPLFVAANPRTALPSAVGGAIQVASFNVLNYFNGDGVGGGFPTPRGATTPGEFARQRAKIISAIRALDADIVGLMELENDDNSPTSAIQDLVNGLNESLPVSQTYLFVDPGVERLGGDAIKVGILYRPAIVSPVGPAATLNTGSFDQNLADGGISRHPLAQTFANSSGERLTVVVNHFKSKRGGEQATGGNADAGDGAGAWNQRRTEAAQNLAAWLDSDPTGSNDPDFLIIGDLNAYARETPVTTLVEAGYVNLLARFNGEHTYSFVFDGQAGYLDHALASESLASQAVGATDWHINADEPPVIGYEEGFNPPGYYAESVYRASDHDPVLVGFNLAAITTTNPITNRPVITEPGIVTPIKPITITPVITEPVAPSPTDPVTVTPVITEPVTPQPTEPTTEPESGGGAYVVQSGDSLTLLARRFGISLRELAGENGLTTTSYLYIGQKLRIPARGVEPTCARQHTVQSGDTLIGIGQRYGVAYGRLAAVNNLVNPNLIRLGQTLCIPEGT